MDLARFSAQVEQRLRQARRLGTNAEEAGPTKRSADGLQALHAKEPGDVPPHLDELSEEEAMTYIAQHFQHLGVPAGEVARAKRAVPAASLAVPVGVEDKRQRAGRRAVSGTAQRPASIVENKA